MNPTPARVQARAVRALALIVALYVIARLIGWTGPHTTVDWRPDLMYPAVLLITLWAIAKLARR